MSIQGTFSPFHAVEQRRTNRSLPHSGVERRFSSSIPPPGQGQLRYPSPPMSSPPSPPLSNKESSYSAASDPSTLASTNVSLSSGTASTLPIAAPLYHTAGLTAPGPRPATAAASLHSGKHPDLSGDGLSMTDQASSQALNFGLLRANSFGPTPSRGTASTPAAQPVNRNGRKSKIHVASACFNCKRAHLSCDVQRPCARCVASGKQETCYDVKHKKRGRPRLREEGDFKVERMVAENPGTLATTNGHSARPVAAPRQRRADSFRSLRSQANEGLSLLTPSLPPVSTFQPAWSHPHHSSFVLAPAEVPTAFLDVDLVILRANQPFQQIMNGGKDVKGYHLVEKATSADHENFQSIRNRLRAEREAREPSYMPPIVQSWQDPIQGVSEADIERLTYGFADHTYTWTRNPPGPTAETFPARVRLAKAIAYFVVVTLPSFRPAAPPKNPSSASLNHWAPPLLSPISAHQATSIPGGVYPPTPASFLRPFSLPPSSGTTFPPMQRPTSYQHPIGAPILPPIATEPLFEARSLHAPATAVGEQAQTVSSKFPSQSESVTSTTFASAPSPAKTETTPRRKPSVDDGEDGTPKKRRRLGIEEVLQ